MKALHIGFRKPLQTKGGKASLVFCVYLIQHCFLSSHLGVRSKDAQVLHTGCKSTLDSYNVCSQEGSKQVLVPSSSIFHLILQICFWGIFTSFCQIPCRANGSGAKGLFYCYSTYPPPPAKTDRVDLPNP